MGTKTIKRSSGQTHVTADKNKFEIGAFKLDRIFSINLPPDVTERSHFTGKNCSNQTKHLEICKYEMYKSQRAFPCPFIRTLSISLHYLGIEIDNVLNWDYCLLICNNE